MSHHKLSKNVCLQKILSDQFHSLVDHGVANKQYHITVYDCNHW